MRNLLSAEMLRLRSRFAYRVVVVAAALIVAMLLWPLVGPMAPPTPDEVTYATNTYTTEQRIWEDNHAQWEEECLAQGGQKPDCEPAPPALSQFLPYRAEAMHVAMQSLLLVGCTLAAAAFVIGASFTSREIRSTWLTFTWSRSRLLAARMVVVAAAALVGGAIMTTTTLILVMGFASHWGLPLTAPSELVWTVVRAVLFVVLAAVTGCAVGSLAERTAVALAVTGAYLFVGLIVDVLLYGRTKLPSVELIYQALAWIRNGQQYSLWPPGSDGGEVRSFTISAAQGGLVWLGVATVLVVAAFVVNARRDVTRPE